LVLVGSPWFLVRCFGFDSVVLSWVVLGSFVGSFGFVFQLVIGDASAFLIFVCDGGLGVCILAARNKGPMLPRKHSTVYSYVHRPRV
jgi:hypothetical protein